MERRPFRASDLFVNVGGTIWLSIMETLWREKDEVLSRDRLE